MTLSAANSIASELPQPLASCWQRLLQAWWSALRISILAVAMVLAAADRPLANTGLIVVAQADLPDAPVGEALTTETPQRPEIPIAEDVGGVLTRRGMLVLEPSLRAANTSARRLTFRGIEVVEAVLIGVIEAEDADRNFLEAALTARLGLTDRLEASVRVSGIYRDDDVSFLIPGVDSPAESRSIDSFGFGDVEVILNYQINQLRAGRPIFVANLRGRFPTGKGPFDVDRDEDGIETELPTGSGFYSIEPSITTLYPVDPVVFFTNLGYQWNIERSINKTIAGNRIGKVDPGDAVRASFGMGFAISDRTSLSLSYSHDYFFKTETEINQQKLKSSTVQVGSLAIGFSNRFSDRVRADVSIEIGATANAPDAAVTLRLPISFNLF